MDKLFIPTKLRVGYQKRDDTYTKRLAYVIYYDSTGKLRKEKSFESWRDKKIDVEEFENKPHSGFMLNKGVKRYGHWNSSGRSMIRVYDDRGIEFEITINNLMFALMTTDCLKRGLEGEFVYAWHGTELVLLPTGCEEYAESQDFTSLQGKKIGSKDMIPGCSYRTKKAEDLIYLGRFDWFEMDYDKKNGGHYYNRMECVRPKQYVFFQEGKYRNFIHLSSLSSLASLNSDVVVSNYADLMDQYNTTFEASRVVELGDRPYDFELGEIPSIHHNGIIKMKDGGPCLKSDSGYVECTISAVRKYNNGVYDFIGYKLDKHRVHSITDSVYRTNSIERNYNRNWGVEKTYTEAELRAMPFVKAFLIKSNHKQILIP